MSAEDIILQFLLDQNRPFNCQLVTDNMQKHQIKKPTVQKVLDALGDEQKIVAKEYNKSKIYHARQDQLTTYSPEELAAVENTVKELQQTSAAEQEELSKRETELALATQTASNEKLAERLNALEQECTELETKLAPLRGHVDVVDKAEVEQAEKLYIKRYETYRKRRRMFKEVFGALVESSDKRPAQLQEDLGIENDEDNGADPNVLEELFTNVNKQHRMNGLKSRRLA